MVNRDESPTKWIPPPSPWPTGTLPGATRPPVCAQDEIIDAAIASVNATLREFRRVAVAAIEEVNRDETTKSDFGKALFQGTANIATEDAAVDMALRSVTGTLRELRHVAQGTVADANLAEGAPTPMKSIHKSVAEISEAAQ